MRILHVITSLSTGGAETMLLKLVGALQSREFEFRVVSLTDSQPIGPKLCERGAQVLALGGARELLRKSARMKIHEFALDWEPQIMHTWMYHANVFGHLALRTMHWPVVPAHIGSVRGALSAPQLQKLTTRLTRRADAILSSHLAAMVFNSEAAAHQHVAAGYCAANVVVVPNGFDTTQFAPDPMARGVMREKLGIADEAVACVMVARWHPLKGHALLLGALQRACQSCDKLRLVLIGRGCSVGNVDLMQIVERMGLTEQVLLLGERSDVARCCSAGDFAVSASLSESFPNGIGEAMACGLPAIVTDVGDCAYLVGPAGRVVPAGDVSALADALVWMATMSEPERAALGQQARARILERFQLRHVAQQFAVLYQRLSAGSGAAGLDGAPRLG